MLDAPNNAETFTVNVPFQLVYKPDSLFGKMFSEGTEEDREVLAMDTVRNMFMLAPYKDNVTGDPFIEVFPIGNDGQPMNKQVET